MPIRPKLDLTVVRDDVFVDLVSDFGRKFFEVKETVVVAFFGLEEGEQTSNEAFG